MTPVLMKGTDLDTLSHNLGTPGKNMWVAKDAWPSPGAGNMEHIHTHAQRSAKEGRPSLGTGNMGHIHTGAQRSNSTAHTSILTLVCQSPDPQGSISLLFEP